MLNPSPFELRQGRFFRAYFSNIKELLFNPLDYFKKFKLFEKTGGAVLFAYCNHLFLFLCMSIFHISLVALLVYFGNASGEFSMQDLTQDLPPDIPPFVVENFPKLMAAGLGFFYIFGLLLGPLMQIAVTFLWSGIHHLFLMVVGGTKQSFEKTVQVHLLFSFVGLISMPFMVFMIIPILGVLLGVAFGLMVFIYMIFYYVVGMAEVHQISTGRAFASGLVMVFSCCCLMALPVFLIAMLPAIISGISDLPNQ